MANFNHLATIKVAFTAQNNETAEQLAHRIAHVAKNNAGTRAEVVSHTVEDYNEPMSPETAAKSPTASGLAPDMLGERRYGLAPDGTLPYPDAAQPPLSRQSEVTR